MGNCITSACPRKRAKKLPGTLVFGYRIMIHRATGPGEVLPTIFSPSIPEQWLALQHDPTVISAILKRRGREIDRYARVMYVQ